MVRESERKEGGIRRGEGKGMPLPSPDSRAPGVRPYIQIKKYQLGRVFSYYVYFSYKKKGLRGPRAAYSQILGSSFSSKLSRNDDLY